MGRTPLFDNRPPSGIDSIYRWYARVRRTGSGKSVNHKHTVFSTICLVLAGSLAGQLTAQTPAPTTQRPLLDKYCVTCHSDKLKTGGLSLQSADLAKVPENAEIWEKDRKSVV